MYPDLKAIGASIRRIRKARGMTQAQLAAAIGKAGPRAISEREGGKTELRGSEVAALCSALGCTLAELFGLEASPIESMPKVYSRGNAATRKGVQSLVERACRHLKLLNEIEAVLGEEPRWVVPFLGKDYPPKKSKHHMREQAVRLAAETRRSLDIGAQPIAELRTLLESAGVVIADWHLPEGLSGFSLRHCGRPFIAVSPEEPERRKRFSLAHEFAHVLADASEKVILTRDYAVERKGYGIATNVERRADWFAGEFLMPEDMVRRFIGSRFDLLTGREDRLDAICEVADHFGVSTKAAALTLAYQRILPWADYHVLKDSLPTRPEQESAHMDRLNKFYVRWAGKLTTSVRMLRLTVRAITADSITDSRARELLMTDQNTLSRFFKEYVDIRNAQTHARQP